MMTTAASVAGAQTASTQNASAQAAPAPGAPAMIDSTVAGSGQASAGSGADPSQGQVAEVVVTAQRRAETLQTVPISVTAFTADQIQQDRIEGISGYLGRTPNVSFINNGSRDRVDIAIRGVSNDLNPYSDIRPSSFAFYVDDFNVATITTNPQVTDLSRIEVLRGPQPTYFGRNAEAGAINIYTQPPTDKQDYEVGVDYSSFNTLKADAAINIPVAPGAVGPARFGTERNLRRQHSEH